MTATPPPGSQPADEGAYPTHPVAGLQQVLSALADPVRLEVVRRLAADGGGPVPCARLYDQISKSTASHHFKTLREAGITERSVVAGQSCQALRMDAVERALPGLLTAVLDAAAGVSPPRR
jgi:DNA-binding transcriptional ArsR family regulator